MNGTKYKLTIGAVVALNLILALALFGQTPAADIRPLPAGKTVEREIKAAEEHFYAVKLKAGEVLRLQLEEGQEANYIFRLIKADSGETIIDADLTQTFGREEITYIAPAKENLKVLVKAPEKIADPAKYKLTATFSKRATEADKERIKAEELSREATKLTKDAVNLLEENRKESYKKSATSAEEALNLRRKQGDKYWEGWTLTFLGNLNTNLRDNQKALDYYNQALQVIKPSNNKIAEAIILVYMGTTYSRLLEPTKAIEIYNQALEIFRELKDRKREGITLSHLGNLYAFFILNPLDIYERTNQSEKALQYYQQALAIFQELKDYAQEVETLDSISRLYYRGLIPREKARVILEQALTITQKTKDKKAESQILRNLGHLLGDDEIKALNYYEQALIVEQEINHKKGQYEVLRKIAYIYPKVNGLRKKGKNKSLVKT